MEHPVAIRPSAMQLCHTYAFLIVVVGLVGRGLTIKVEQGKGCLTEDGGPGVCVRQEMCPALAKVSNRQHVQRTLENFIL